MSQQTEVPSKALFHAWKHNEVTERLMRLMKAERERMVLGVVYNHFENPEDVKGRIQAVDRLLDLQWEDLYNEE